MRRILVLGLVIFCAAFVYGYAAMPADAQAAGGGGFCWYQCGCNGVPEFCCFNGLGVSCKPAPWAPISCPQIADC